jgi:hypothetical protein
MTRILFSLVQNNNNVKTTKKNWIEVAANYFQLVDVCPMFTYE